MTIAPNTPTFVRCPAQLGWLLALLLALLVALAPSFAAAAERTRVVATFSVLADLVRQVGGERVDIITLVGPDADAHTYVPAPRDAAAVAKADVLVSNGLGFEGWIDRLREAAQFRGHAIVASRGVTPRAAPGETGGDGDGHDHAIDPHAFQTPANAAVYAQNIADGLCTADPDGCPDYRRHAIVYQQALLALTAEIGRTLAAIPAERRIIVMPHAALGYFADFHGLTVLAATGPNPGGEPSAADMATLIRTIKASGARALFQEGQSTSRLLEQVAKETGVPIAGRLYTDALTGKDGPAPDLLTMFRHNATAIAAAIGAR